MTDESNCGGCGNTCDAGEYCVNGGCRCGTTGPNCAPSDVCCGTNCYNPMTNPSHCGGCNQPCGTGENCTGGSCFCGVSPACTGGTTCCGTVCEDLANDPDNCGNCGFQCNNNAYCSGGSCQCNVPWANCNGNWNPDGCEINTQTDPSHCGGCNQLCNLPNVNVHTCIDYVCNISSCDAGWYNLDQSPTNTNGCECDTTESESTGGTCGGAVDMGIIYDTGAIDTRREQRTGNLAFVGDVDWYKVDVRDQADTTTCATGKTGETFDFRIAICPAGGQFQVDVFKGDCSTQICSDEDTGLTYDFSGTYALPGDAGGGLCQCTATETDSARICDNFTSAPWGNPNPAAVYSIRVERTGASTTCGDYTIKVVNNPGSASDYSCP
jgi:hypothetical protein